MSSASTSPDLPLACRVRLLATLHPRSPPAAGSESVEAVVDGVERVFDAHAFMCAIPSMWRDIPSEQRRALRNIGWFDSHMTVVGKGALGRLPTCDELAAMIALACPTARPGAVDTYKLRLGDEHVVFCPAQALSKLAVMWSKPEGPTPAAKARLRALSWGRRWMEVEIEGAEPRAGDAAVTRRVKIEILRIFYPFSPPSPTDEIPVSLDDDSVWVFRPHKWLTSAARSFLANRGTLSAAEKHSLEEMEWVEDFVEKATRRAGALATPIQKAGRARRGAAHEPPPCGPDSEDV